MARIEVFAGPNCGYCARAKALLAARGLRYVERDISEDVHRDELLRRLPRSRSIPQIFIDGEHVGGSEDLEILDRKGLLESLAAADRTPAG